MQVSQSILALALFLPVVAVAAPEPHPQVPAVERTRLIATAGVFPLGFSGGLKVRGPASRFEAGLRYSTWPGRFQAIDGRINILDDNPAPRQRGTWFAGPELMYTEEYDEYGTWKMTALQGLVGWERKLGSRLIYSHEFGGGWLLASSRAPLIPFTLMTRAELSMQIL